MDHELAVISGSTNGGTVLTFLSPCGRSCLTQPLLEVTAPWTHGGSATSADVVHEPHRTHASPKQCTGYTTWMVPSIGRYLFVLPTSRITGDSGGRSTVRSGCFSHSELLGRGRTLLACSLNVSSLFGFAKFTVILKWFVSWRQRDKKQVRL